MNQINDYIIDEILKKYNIKSKNKIILLEVSCLGDMKYFYSTDLDMNSSTKIYMVSFYIKKFLRKDFKITTFFINTESNEYKKRIRYKKIKKLKNI